MTQGLNRQHREGLTGRATAWVATRAWAWPRTVLLGLMVLCTLAAYAASGLRVDTDSSRMIAPDLPAQQAALVLNEKFPALKSTILITITAAEADMADLAVADLIDALEAQPTTIKSVFSPSADRYLMAHGFLYKDAEDLDEMFDRLSKSANLLAHLRADPTLDGFARALIEAIDLADRAEIGPDALERLFAETASVLEAQALDKARIFSWSAVMENEPSGQVTRQILIQPELDHTRLSPARPALNAIDAAIATLPIDRRAALTIGVTGEPALRAAELRSVTETLWISLLLSLLLVAALLRWGLGSWGRVSIALAVLVVSLVLTAGAAAITVGALNLISVAFIVLMVGLGIDFAVHIIAHIAELRHHGTAPAQAVPLAGLRSGRALATCAITTAVAFLAFTITDFHGMAQLGVIGAGGVVIAWAVAVVLIPALLAVGPSLAGDTAPLTIGSRSPKLRQVRLRQAWLAAVTLMVGAAAIWPALQARFEADPMALRDPESPSVQAFRLLAEKPETSPYRASIMTETAAEADRMATLFDDSAGIGTALNLGDLVPERQDQKLDLLDFAAPSIDHAVSGQPTALVADQDDTGDRMAALIDRLAGREGMAQRLNRALQAYLDARTAETDTQLADRIFRSFRLLVSRLEVMLDADRVSGSALPAEMRERFQAADGTYRVEIVPEGSIVTSTEAAKFAARVTDVAPSAAGGPIQLAAAGATVAKAMLIATLLAALSTAALCLVATRSLVDTAAVLVPLAVAALLTIAFGVLTGIPFNYANVIVLPLMIGIGVDSGIHLIQRERQAPGAVFQTSTPGAVTVSAATTVAAFGTLALSAHRGTASMGILLAVGVTLTVVTVLILTPQIRRWLLPLRHRA
ncbi:MAG: MMPL family transporter [Pseudomonadota bacterium]